MKILMVEPGPDWSVADVHNGWRKAFGLLGCDVRNLNYSDRLSFYASAGCMKDGEFVRHVDDTEAVRMAAKGLEVVCYEWWPDIVVVTSGFYIPPETFDVIRSRGHKLVMLHTESPYEDERQLARAEHVTFNVLNDPTNLARFETVGPSMYLPHAYDPDIHHPGSARFPDDESDFCFIGSGYPSRIQFLEQVDWTDIDVALGGNWQKLTAASPLRKHLAHDISRCLDNADTADLYRATKMSANLYRREAEAAHLVAGWAMGPREVELAACGVPFLRDPRGEGDDLLHMLPTFTTPEDFSGQLRWWLTHDKERERVADQAREAINDRTFTNNARRLLAALEPSTKLRSSCG